MNRVVPVPCLFSLHAPSYVTGCACMHPPSYITAGDRSMASRHPPALNRVVLFPLHPLNRFPQLYDPPTLGSWGSTPSIP